MNNEQYVKAFLSQESFFILNKSFIKELGLNEAALLALLIDRHNSLPLDDKGWFYSIKEYLQSELNLGRKPIDAALNNLETKYLVHTCRRGIPAKKYFQIDWTNIRQLMENIGLSSTTNSDNTVSPKRTNLTDQNGLVSKKEDNKKEQSKKESIPPISPKGDGECETLTKEKELFESFRLAYRGTKRGLNTEFDNFCKKHKDWRKVLPELLALYQKQCEQLDRNAAAGGFVPQPKNLQTYINQRCWEDEIQNVQPQKLNHHATTTNNRTGNAAEPQPAQPNYSYFQF